MPRWPILACWLALALLAPAETLDRIAVTVGRHVISERDVLEDLRLSAFLDGQAPDFSGGQKRKAADRLIDRYLVLEDAVATRATLPTSQVAAALVVPVKERYATDAEYRAALAQAQVTEAGLNAHLLAGLRMLRYTDLRFRPEVQLSEENLRAYYKTLTEQRPSTTRSFEASRDQIEKLLTDQQTMQALDRWLGMTRSETQILYREAVFK